MRPAVLWTLVVAVLLLFGLARLPFEKSLDTAHRAAGLRTAALNIELREEIGQLSSGRIELPPPPRRQPVEWITIEAVWDDSSDWPMFFEPRNQTLIY
jgi:hypothetical protein